MPENEESGSAGGDPAANDDWATAVRLITGYPMPPRSGLFDDLKSENGIPLFEVVGIDHWPVQSAAGNWGWQTYGFDFVVPFYETQQGDGSHRGVRMRGVNIRFIGKDGAHLLSPGENLTPEGNRTNLAAYISGPRVALDALRDSPYSTRNVSYAGLTVANPDHVSLDSFQRSGMAFDRAALFFQGRADVLQQWENAFGQEESPWRGQAAGAFWDLIHTIRRNYDGYVDQMGGRNYTPAHTFLGGHTPASQIADSLAWAQESLWNGVKSLRASWEVFAGGWHDPWLWLRSEIQQLAGWIVENNHRQVRMDGSRPNGNQQGNSTTPQLTAEKFDRNYWTDPGFRQNHPTYGFLAWPDSFRGVGQEAIDKWSDYVDYLLGEVARDVMRELTGLWARASENVGEQVHPRDTRTPTDIYNEGVEDANEESLEQLFGPDGLLGGGGVGELLNGGGGLGDLSVGGGGGELSDVGGGVGELLNGGGGLGDLSAGGGGGELSDVGGGVGELLNGGEGLGDLSAGGGGDGGADGGLSGIPLNPDTTPGSALPGDGDETSLTPPVTRLNPDGSLTTVYPNGNSVTLNPRQGTAVTTKPDGSTVTTDLEDGPLLNPDGSITVANPDGSVTTTSPDGTVSVLNPDTDTRTELAPDGTLTTTFTDGTAIEVDPDTGLATVTEPDGGTTTTDLNNGSLEAPDGSTIALDPDSGVLTTTHPDGTTVTLDPATGNIVTEHPDGTVTTLNPDTDTLTTTKPDGSSTTIDLNGPTQPNTDTGEDRPDPLLPGDGDSLNLSDDFTGGSIDTGSYGGGGSSLLNSGLDTVGSAGIDGLEDGAYFDEDEGAGQAGRGIGSPAVATEPGTSAGTLLNPDPGETSTAPGTMGPGTMGPGMMGAGGAGGGKEGGSERQREVHAGATGASGLTPRRKSRSAALDDEDAVITRGRTATSTGAYGGGTGPGQRRTESADRIRASWKPEDEDVWGTDEGGAPAVVGR
ncbi:AAWKG family protein [Streptomyces sp. NPDC050263]|uniref:AAWKG family protein n=1 Tax=Streptomyces sp. NPDC050263 TaxID=3155037 RepID=UPI00342ED15E